MPQSVDWDLAQRVAVGVSRRAPYPVPRWREVATMAEDFRAATAKAELLVGESTGLISAEGRARARVVDRAAWIDVNIASFQRLLRPLTDRLAANRTKAGTKLEVTRRIAGFEVGVVLGWMSTRVLGQYDLLIIEDDTPDQGDMVYYVGPNIAGLERRHGFPPHEFRLWLALHEVTHRAQFTGIPWLREHFLKLVEDVLDVVEPDAGGLADAVIRILEARRKGEDPFLHGGLSSLLAPPEQQETIEKLTGMMSLLEGHGDVTMDRAGAGGLSEAERFGRVLRARRNSARGLMKVFTRIAGIEAKMNQYQAGEDFIEAVERSSGLDFVDKAWQGPEFLPTYTEIRDPEKWIARVGAAV